MMDAQINVLGIAGSLRKGSLNRALLRAAGRLSPGHLTIRVFDGLDAVPLFNEDIEGPPEKVPAGVKAMHEAVANCDGILFATPEYNQSMSGVLKNAIDWISRAVPNCLGGKPVAIMGATAGMWGTRLAQAALRQTLHACGTLVMPTPAIYIAGAANILAPDGVVEDAQVRADLANFLESYCRWIQSHIREQR